MTLIKSISGIRGTIGGKTGETLSPVDIVKFASAYGSWIKNENKNPKVIIGRDSRPTGLSISQLVSATLLSLGIDVLDLGLSTTPTVEIAVTEEEAGGGIIISASHNPITWNALKLLNYKGEFLLPEESKIVLSLAETDDYSYVPPQEFGTYQTDNTYIDKHIDLILKLPLVDQKAIAQKDFRIVVDAVNSSGGIAIPKLLAALGIKEVNCLYCEPNGQFPHNPEPLPENLKDISHTLEQGNYDLGIVVDPDVDRLAFVCEDGTMFGEEYTLVAVADYILQQNPGMTVSNLSSTLALRDITEKAGQKYATSAVGEVNVVKKMKEVGAVIGGEGNGGIIYPELHYGRDALVGIALFLTHLSHSGKTASELKASYPNYQISKNKISLTPEINVDLILEKIQEKYQSNPINTTDGVKIEFDASWVHLRKSNTEPIIRIYSEARSLDLANALAQKIMNDVQNIVNNKEHNATKISS